MSSIVVRNHNHPGTTLENLQEGVLEEIVVMVSREWSNETLDGTYRTTDYLLSDRLGNVVQCYVIHHALPVPAPSLTEGKIYRLKYLLIVPGQTEYRIYQENNHVLLFQRKTVATELEVDTIGFIRYPFRFIDFQEIRYVERRYLIDVVGHVVGIGNVATVPGNFKYLYCRLIDDRGVTLKITVWDRIYEIFLEKRAYAPPNTAVIFTSLSVEQVDGILSLHTTLETTIHNLNDLEPNNALASMLPLNKPPLPPICKASADSAEQESLYPTEFLNTLKFPGMPPHVLNLKKGIPVMLLRNVNPSQGLCNGTRLIVEHLGEWVIEATISTGSHVGEKILIPKITMTSPTGQWPFVMKRRQYPIKPCYAMTINKSQGQSLKHVGVYLPKPVFCHGQLYVVASRVTDPSGLKFALLDNTPLGVNCTRNIVFREAFNNLNNHAHERQPDEQENET